MFFVTYAHTLITAILLAGVLLMGVGFWQLSKGAKDEMFLSPPRLALS